MNRVLSLIDSHSLCRGGVALASLLSVAGFAKAQTQWCDPVTVTYAAVPISVPSLSALGVALLVAGLALLAWRQRKHPGARLMAAALWVAAALIANEGGGGWIQKAYAAALNLDLPNASGGTAVIAVTAEGDTLTLSNTSGSPLNITGISSIANGCGAGTTLGVGASCTANIQGATGMCSPCPPGSVWNGFTCVRVP